MALDPTVWTLICMSLFMLCFPLLWALYYIHTRMLLPPGVQQRGKIRLLTLSVNIMFGVALFLEKVGICHRIKIWRAFLDGLPLGKSPDLLIQDLLFEEVAVRVYWPKASPSGERRGLVYLHGGVGFFGSIQAYERLCRCISRESDTVVVSVGFRLAPEHPYPAQLLDCCTATVHFLKNAKEYGVDSNRIAVCGDSSGGTLATLVCHALVTEKDLPKLRAQILFYPFLQALDFTLPSYQQYHSVPPLFKKRAIRFIAKYFNEKVKDVDGIMKNAHVPEEMRVKYRKWVHADHVPEEFKAEGYVPLAPAPFSEELYEMMKESLQPEYSPLLAEDAVICQLPEMFILTCEYDILRDDGLLYKKRLEDNGVPVTWHHVKDGLHGVLYVIDYGSFEYPSTQSSFQHVKHFLERL